MRGIGRGALLIRRRRSAGDVGGQELPIALGRTGPKRAVGPDDHWRSDSLEQFDVVARVAVADCRAEIEPVLVRELARERDFSTAERMPLRRPCPQSAAAFAGERRPQMLDNEV